MDASRYCTECGQDMGCTYSPPIECDGCTEHRRGMRAGVQAERRRMLAWLQLRHVRIEVEGHVYLGSCPDELEGWDSRDPECPACQQLDRVLRGLASDAWPTVARG